MKTCMLLALVVVSAVAEAGASRPRRADTYTTQYDNVNVLEVLKNPRLFEAFKKCLLEDGPCSNEGKALKEAIPDALTNGCAKCNEKQQDGARVAIKYIRVEKPEVWTLLKEKHDPTGIYETKYQKELERL